MKLQRCCVVSKTDGASVAQPQLPEIFSFARCAVSLLEKPWRVHYRRWGISVQFLIADVPPRAYVPRNKRPLKPRGFKQADILKWFNAIGKAERVDLELLARHDRSTLILINFTPPGWRLQHSDIKLSRGVSDHANHTADRDQRRTKL